MLVFVFVISSLGCLRDIERAIRFQGRSSNFTHLNTEWNEYDRYPLLHAFIQGAMWWFAAFVYTSRSISQSFMHLLGV